MIRVRRLTRRRTLPALVSAIAASGLLGACGEPAPAGSEAAAAPQTLPAADAVAEEATRALPGSIAWAIEGGWRLDAERARDGALHPGEVAELLNLDTAESVLELNPGAGDWTAILAPTVAARGGRYVAALLPAGMGEGAGALAARFAERFSDETLFGPIEQVELGPASPALAEPGSIAAALSVDDAATWMALGYLEKALADVHAALAPGGRFGLVAPRAPVGGAQDPTAASGYLQQSYVVRLAEEAGFELDSSWELLANPADDADHPFGVWTLQPYRLTAPLGAPADPAFDRSEYDAIGEPDRMLLLFRKPRAEEPPPPPAETEAPATEE